MHSFETIFIAAEGFLFKFMLDHETLLRNIKAITL